MENRKPLSKMICEQHPKLRRSILDPAFTYRRAHDTDIRKTFAAVAAVDADRAAMLIEESNVVRLR